MRKKGKKNCWGGGVVMGDHPSDSGTEMLLRGRGNRSVSLLVNLWRFSSQFLPECVCVYVCVHHVQICILCGCMSVSLCVHLCVYAINE